MQQQGEIHFNCRQAGCKVMNWHQTPKKIEQLEVATIPKTSNIVAPIRFRCQDYHSRKCQGRVLHQSNFDRRQSQLAIFTKAVCMLFVVTKVKL